MSTHPYTKANHDKHNHRTDPVRNGEVYSKQYNFRMTQGGTLAEAKQAWLIKTGTQWLTPSQVEPSLITIPTVNTFEGRFNLRSWLRGTPRPEQPKRDRTVINNAADRMEERELAGLVVLRREFPEVEYDIEDHRKGEQVGADYAVISRATKKVFALVDIKSGNVMSAPQVKIALQVEQEGVEYWLLDPENDKAMRVTKECEFIPTGYRVYPRAAAAIV